MVFAEFIARRSGAGAVAAYREAFQPSLFRPAPWAGIATIAMAADTAEEAERLSALQPLPRTPGPPDAPGFVRRFLGSGEQVRDYLSAKAEETACDELFVMAAGPTVPARIRSLELMAELVSIRA